MIWALPYPVHTKNRSGSKPAGTHGPAPVSGPRPAENTPQRHKDTKVILLNSWEILCIFPPARRGQARVRIIQPLRLPDFRANAGQSPEGTTASGSRGEDRFGGGKGILAANARECTRMFLSGGTARASAPSYPRSSACIRGQISSFSPATRSPWARVFPRAIAPRGLRSGHGGLSQGSVWRADKNSYHGEARRRLPPPSPDEWSAAPM